MRLLLIFIGLALSANLSAQLPKKIKYDKLVYSKDSSLVMIEYNQKQSLYNIEKREYKEEPGESRMTYLSDVDCFLAAPADGGKPKLFEPDSVSVNRKEQGFLLEYRTPGVRSELQEWSYAFVGFNGEILFKDMHVYEVATNQDLWILCLEDIIADTVSEAPGGKFRHSKYKEPPFYYAIENDKMGMIRPEWESNKLVVKWSAKPEEFVHYNPDLDFEFWIENDSIYFKSADNRTSVGLRDKNSIVYYKDMNNPHADENFSLVATDYGMTSLKNDFLGKGWNMNVASIRFENGTVLINDLCTTAFDVGHERDHYSYIFESENSSAWQKKDGQWIRMTPYYAAISAVPGGYIARSGFYKETAVVFFDSPVKTNTEMPSRYFLLDSNFNAIPFMDYYDFALIEDLGFGLKISFDNTGSFFMTYDHVAVTNAEWDDFKLFNNKLEAILYEKPLLDENGNQVYDANGVPQKISESVTKFFKLP